MTHIETDDYTVIREPNEHGQRDKMGLRAIHLEDFDGSLVETYSSDGRIGKTLLVDSEEYAGLSEFFDELADRGGD